MKADCGKGEGSGCRRLVSRGRVHVHDRRRLLVVRFIIHNSAFITAVHCTRSSGIRCPGCPLLSRNPSGMTEWRSLPGMGQEERRVLAGRSRLRRRDRVDAQSFASEHVRARGEQWGRAGASRGEQRRLEGEQGASRCPGCPLLSERGGERWLSGERGTATPVGGAGVVSGRPAASRPKPAQA